MAVEGGMGFYGKYVPKDGQSITEGRGEHSWRPNIHSELSGDSSEWNGESTNMPAT